MVPKIRKNQNKNRKVKVNLVFNEESRREFLTGFHKRKLQRKKKAKDKLEQELKEEKKRLKLEAKESYKKLIKSHTPIPEVENLLTEEYEDEDVNVKVVELSTTEIAKQNHWIGTNQLKEESDHSEVATSENEDNSFEAEVPGMELKSNEGVSHEEVHKPKELKSKAEIKKLLKKQATKNVQKSKAFQLKNKIESQKQKKKALQKRKTRMMVKNKSKNKNKRS